MNNAAARHQDMIDADMERGQEADNLNRMASDVFDNEDLFDCIEALAEATEREARARNEAFTNSKFYIEELQQLIGHINDGREWDELKGELRTRYCEMKEQQFFGGAA